MVAEICQHNSSITMIVSGTLVVSGAVSNPQTCYILSLVLVFAIKIIDHPLVGIYGGGYFSVEKMVFAYDIHNIH